MAQNCLFFATLLLVTLTVTNGNPLQTNYQTGNNAQVTTLQQLLASNGLANRQGVTLFLIAPQKMIRTTALSSGGVAAGQDTVGAYETVSSTQEVNYNSPASPVRVNYQSQSAPLDVQHTHIPAPKPELQHTRSEEEPHVLIHEIIRPVIQEVREIIQPYRRILQEIRPVQETVVQNIYKQGGGNSRQVATAEKPAKPLSGQQY